MNHLSINGEEPKVAIIVLGYKNRIYLPDCFDSIAKLEYQNTEVYYVDNNSCDGSPEFIRETYPAVKVIVNNANFGFARGNNIGISAAISDGADVVMLLNPDTIIDKLCINKLIENYSPHTILQPLVLLYEKEKTNKVNTSGNHLQFLGVSYCGEINIDRKLVKSRQIASASGSAMFIPKAVISNVGLFDEDFFMYNEDLDLCWRARINGFDIRLVHDAIVWHKYKFSKNKLKYFFIEKNRLLFLLKNYQLITLILIFPALLIHEICALTLSIFGGWFLQKIRADLVFIYQAPRAVAKRFHAKRQHTDYELSQFVSYKVDFPLISLPAVNIYNKFMKIYWELVKFKLRILL